MCEEVIGMVCGMVVCVFCTILGDVGQVGDDLVCLPLVRGGSSCERHGCGTEQKNSETLLDCRLKCI